MAFMSVVFVSVCLSVGVGSAAQDAPEYMDSTRAEFFRGSAALIFDDRFTEADSAYSDYISAHPTDPAGYLFRAGGLMADMADREEDAHSKQFNRLLDSTLTLTRSILETCDDRTAAWMYLLRGHVTAYRSLYESRFGSFIKALRLGLSANDDYERGLKRDSTLYDLYAGLGSYHYWKSAKAGMLKWIGLFRNEKDKGLRELRLAADSSILHRQAARSAMIWIWLDRGEYDSTIAVATDFAARYPDGKTFLWPIAQAWFKQEEYEQSLGAFKELREKLAVSPGNCYNLVECDFFITQCHDRLGHNNETHFAARRLWEYLGEIPESTRKRQKDKLDYLKRLAQE